MDSPRPLPWEPDPRYRKAVAYFSMEYAIDQALKIYAGGLGFLAGSHMRSAHDLQQNLIGIGILWKYGYYDQVRQDDQCMRVQFIRKYYPFLQPTDLRAQVSDNAGTCPIIGITNAQNARFWQDPQLRQALHTDDDAALVARKQAMKRALFEEVADQTGKLFDPQTLTLVWARRFAAYKRADLLLHDLYRFNRLLEQQERPVQIIWAGKPFPFDQTAVDMFDQLVRLTWRHPRIAVLTGYEIRLSRLLKQGADIWLNTPQRLREASGTSGMTAAMNGAVNLTICDGWVPEFAVDGHNCLLIPPADPTGDAEAQRAEDALQLMELLENRALPMYYDQPGRWLQLMKQGMRDVQPRFDSDRLAHQYYELMYNP